MSSTASAMRCSGDFSCARESLMAFWIAPRPWDTALICCVADVKACSRSIARASRGAPSAAPNVASASPHRSEWRLILSPRPVRASLLARGRRAGHDLRLLRLRGRADGGGRGRVAAVDEAGDDLLDVADRGPLLERR